MLTALFSAAILCSSFLLFSVQPLVTKLVLPALGGTPMVWNTCAVFFQSTLLIGYIYADFIGRSFSPRTNAALHFLLLLLLILLPIHPVSFPDIGSGSPGLPLLLWLIQVIGYPAVLFSTTAPLLQRWFSELVPEKNPYALYAASNVGSLAGLIAYPFIIEPRFGLVEQTRLVNLGLLLALMLLALCSLARFIRGGAKMIEHTEFKAIKKSLIARWLFLSALPSALCLSVTTHITTNIAPVPLLWIAPLSLFLLSFIVAFSSESRATSLAAAMFPNAVLIFLPFVYFETATFPLAMFILHLGIFFLIALMFAARLYESRPAASQLTVFYLSLALGGVLGGLFVTFLAPMLFSEITEYPIFIALACLGMRSEVFLSREKRLRFLLMLCALMIIGNVIAYLVRGVAADSHARLPLQLSLVYALPALFLLSQKHRRSLFALGIALLFVSVSVSEHLVGPNIVLRMRNFYGMKKVNEHDGYRNFVHGGTTHGVYTLAEPYNHMPSGYYASSGGFGNVVDVMRSARGPLRLGVVGLGIGATAPYVRPEDELDYWELDPQVRAIAEDTAVFGYLHGCGARCKVEVGDGRKLIEKTTGGYDLILIDAFSSDAIPVHLLTLEAVRMYREKLKRDGLLVIHISNRYLELSRPVGRIARELGVQAMIRADFSLSEEDKKIGKMPAVFTVFLPDESLRDAFSARGWSALGSNEDDRVWTDDYSNIWRIYRTAN